MTRGDVERFFDGQADGYDTLEPWYTHLYAVLHGLVRETLAPPSGRPAGRALDAGCGTGYQTRLLEALGYRTHGLDLSAGLLRVARRRHPRVALVHGDLEALPYAADAFDAVCCCGSTLAFLGDPACGVAELGRVLRPGGRLLLECEHRWSPDLAWTLVSSLTGDALGYGLRPRAAWRLVAARGVDGVLVDYPGYPRLRLVGGRTLRGWLAAAGLRWRRAWGIHSVTNLIPSTALHREWLPRPLGALYAGLRAADARLAPRAPARWLCNSLVVLAEKPG